MFSREAFRSCEKQKNTKILRKDIEKLSILTLTTQKRRKKANMERQGNTRMMKRKQKVKIQNIEKENFTIEDIDMAEGNNKMFRAIKLLQKSKITINIFVLGEN